MTGFPGEVRPVTMAVWGRTDVGRARRENQDAFLVQQITANGEEGFLLGPDSAGEVSPHSGSFEVGGKGAFLLVADGMGGAAGGAVASRLATVVIAETFRQRWTADRNHAPGQLAFRLREAVEEANRRVHARALERSELHGMGTTATAAAILDGFVYVAQVGDSRAYLIRAGTATQLTRDQSVVQQLVDAGAMTEQEAERSDQRSVLLQALGTDPAIQVDLTYEELRRDDVLLLCSDGLSGQVRAEEMAEAVGAQPDLVSACDALVDLANERGGPDNITVVLARFDGTGLPHPTNGEGVARRVFEPGAV